MAYNKSLELRKIKVTPKYLGNYITVEGKNYRNFKPEDFIYSPDGVQYLVGERGNFLRVQ